MTDKAKWKMAFAIISLLFNAAIIVWLIMYGKSDNSLHTSALAWSYAVGAGVLAGVGFGSIATMLPMFKPVEPSK